MLYRASVSRDSFASVKRPSLPTKYPHLLPYVGNFFQQLIKVLSDSVHKALSLTVAGIHCLVVAHIHHLIVARTYCFRYVVNRSVGQSGIHSQPFTKNECRLLRDREETQQRVFHTSGVHLHVHPTTGCLGLLIMASIHEG